MFRSPSFVAASLGLIVIAALVAGCGLFSNPPAPTASPSTASPSGASPGGASSSGAVASIVTPTRSPIPTITPLPNAVGSIVLVAAIGETGPATPSGLAWQGVQDAADRLGAEPSLVAPRSTTGHRSTQFFELDQTIPDGSPTNVHGLVFDEAEAGYLAGVVAASLTANNNIGMVGSTKTDVRTANYAAGLRSGAANENPAVAVTVAYAGRTDDPQKGRAASAGLIKSRVDVVVAMPGLSGIGAMREACARKAQVIALDTDASLTVPDVTPCLVVSVLKRYDAAIRDAIERYASGEAAPRMSMNDVASGGIALSEFDALVPSGLADQLANVVAAMRSGPPRPTPGPTPTPEPSPTSTSTSTSTPKA
jgi:basic membrane lipoprotein Med (substrate-binding protein (PBP1-ABC) superfamily)